MKFTWIVLSVFLNVATAQANNEFDLTYWHTGNPEASFHHSEECSISNTPALVVSKNKFMIKELTPVKYYFQTKTSEHCSTRRIYEIEKAYNRKLKMLGHKIKCPTNVCKEGTDELVDDIDVPGVFDVLFFDQGYAAIAYFCDYDKYECEEAKFSVVKFDITDPNSIRLQLQKILNAPNQGWNRKE